MPKPSVFSRNWKAIDWARSSSSCFPRACGGERPSDFVGTTSICGSESSWSVAGCGGQLITREVKGRKSGRSVDLPTPVVQLLKDHRTAQAAARTGSNGLWDESGFVFTTQYGSALDPRNVHRDFQTICMKAKLGKWHPHELRHSAASLMLAEGVPLQVVSDILGHSSIRITADVYGHVLQPQRREAARAMAGALWG